MRKTAIFTLVGTAATLLIVNLANVDGANTAGIISEAQAEQVKHMVSPVKAREDHEVYYPGTEDLAPDEMRVTACGTGMPNARPHFGDLDALWVGGVVGNRVVPLRVWGPSSSEPKYGTKKALEAMEEMLAWDVDSRMGNTDTRGLFMEVTEFDYRAINEVIYEENGVTIRTISFSSGTASSSCTRAIRSRTSGGWSSQKMQTSRFTNASFRRSRWWPSRTLRPKRH
jgi:hypothetical protein